MVSNFPRRSIDSDAETHAKGTADSEIFVMQMTGNQVVKGRRVDDSVVISAIDSYPIDKKCCFVVVLLSRH